jgi:hypothetical protein
MNSLRPAPRGWKSVLLRHSAVLVCVVLVAVVDTHAAFADPSKDWAGDWARMKPIVPRGYVCYRAAQPPAIDGRLE